MKMTKQSSSWSGGGLLVVALVASSVVAPSLVAQAEPPEVRAGAAATSGAKAPAPSVAKAPAPKKATASAATPKLGAAARAALRSARELAQRARGQRGAERKRRLELAAAAFDRCVAQFAREPAAVALAAWQGAQVWRRQGSLLLAEKDYLLAAQSDPARYRQRALLGAADMQRRQRRADEALATYARAEAADRSTSHAQRARLWVARLLQARGAIDDAITRFQAALEAAPSPRQAMDAADLLAKAWIVKGDLDAAGFVIDHAEQLVAEHGEDDPESAEQLRRAFAQMPSRRALQRARDEARDAGGDAVRLDEHRRKKVQ